MNLCIDYRRKRVRQLTIEIKAAQHAASRSLLRGDSSGVEFHRARAKGYALERSMLHKPPYWHRGQSYGLHQLHP